MEHYDVIVIGSGQGGNPFALECAKRGKRTALVEHGPLGGTCINTGCTPTKTMIASAKVAFLAGRASEYGVQTGPVSVDMARVRQRKRGMVDDFRSSTEQRDRAAKNLTLVSETASFTGPKSIRAGKRDLSAEVVVIDTGAKPHIPAIVGLTEVPFLDSERIMELEEVPKHLLVLGGGSIGIEFAQMFVRFGSKVTVVERSNRFLAREDADIADAMSAILRQDGVAINLGSTVTGVGLSDEGVRMDFTSNGTMQRLTGSHLLVALGRSPNVEALDLAAAGIETTERGFIKVDERLQTSASGIYAIGDVNGGPQFTHISYDDFRVLRSNLLDGANTTTTNRLIPYVIFTDPELGRVGITEESAVKKNIKHKVFRMPMASVARALETGETRGLVKVIADPDSKLILGAAVLGLEGGEIMNMIQIAMMGGLPYTALRDGIFSHPTLGEGLNTLFTKD